MSSLGRYDIVISSYLGDNKDLQLARLEIHKRQQQELPKAFPRASICVVCSGWPKWALSEWNHLNTIIHRTRLHKYQVHKMVLKELYKRTKPKTVLLLDDDTVPCQMKDLLLDPTEEIGYWLKHPEDMPASCIYFSHKGLFQDIYYKSRDPGLVPCPVFPPGAAIIVRNDLLVYLNKKDVWYKDTQLGDDTIFRNKCAAEGQEVLKHNGLFFESYQTKANDKTSTWFSSREERRECVKKSRQAMIEWWPWLYEQSKNRLHPVWNIKGQKRRNWISLGLLRKTSYGVVPCPKKLKQNWELAKVAIVRPSLLDLI